ncbi:FimB/Mfa2 family fimbrial subunit, partial [uncultured Muribaculum sp.]
LGIARQARSPGRLIDTRTQRLVVRRNSDGEDIININLIQYLLMVKGEYNRQMSNQEYLDRNDNYSLMFFVDDNRNWYIAGGVYINGWRIVPPQDTEL